MLIQRGSTVYDADPFTIIIILDNLRSFSIGAILATPESSDQIVGHCITYYILYYTFLKCSVLLRYFSISFLCFIKSVFVDVW